MQDAQVPAAVPLPLSLTLSTTVKHHHATVTSRAWCNNNHKLEKISGCINWKSSRFNQLENERIRIFV